MTDAVKQEYNQNSVFSQAYGKTLPPSSKPDAPMMHQEPSLYFLPAQSCSDSQVFVLRLKHCDPFTFGEAIKLSVRPRDLSPVKPSLSVLSPLDPCDPGGPGVCLAAGFRPPAGAMVLNGSISIDISEAVVSLRQKTFFFTGFSDGAISSCEMNNVSSSNDHADSCDNVHSTDSHDDNNSADSHDDIHSKNVRFNSYLLLLNAARVMFTKIVAFTSVLTIRTLLARPRLLSASGHAH